MNILWDTEHISFNKQIGYTEPNIVDMSRIAYNTMREFLVAVPEAEEPRKYEDLDNESLLVFRDLASRTANYGYFESGLIYDEWRIVTVKRLTGEEMPSWGELDVLQKRQVHIFIMTVKSMLM